ncbi:MAG: Gfo/Idh/MocA family oxidoreductase [Armatimonadota bacterium]|nr:MAG: Gfo/Idh/MocA family oxidoreductase [Armatimonadota bacterium]
MKQFGCAVHGAGWVSTEHLRAYMKNPHCRVVAISSRTEKSARARADELGLDCKIYTDYDRLLADPAVDCLSICTPNHLHAQETIAAAQAGKHVVIEKPVALNLKDLRAMQKAVKKARVKTVVSFVLRWNPLFDVIKSLLAQRAIGDLFYAELDYWHGIGPWYAQFKWVSKKKMGGSSFLSGGCHAVDAMRYFVGAEVAEVCAFQGATPHAFGYEYSPTVVGIVKFENGVIGKLCSSVEARLPYKFNIDLLGKEGSIRNNELYSLSLMKGQTDMATIPTILPDSGDVTHHPFEGEIDHFVDCIINDVESHVNLDDAVKTHEICLALDESAAKDGKKVKLPYPKS